MTMTNRETVRDQITASLTTELVTTKGVVATGNVYSSRIFDPAGQSPVIGIASMGSQRPVMTARGRRSVFRFAVEVWVVAKGTSWTAANAEDKLDQLEQYIADWVVTNRTAANYWDALDFDDEGTVISDTTIGGMPYLLEVIPLVAYAQG